MAKITPCLWFDFTAEAAVKHYLSVFRNGRILEMQRYGDAMPEHAGKVLTISFEIEGQRLLALNSGPQFPFTEAISLMVDCVDQAEVDALWNALVAGGSESQCGWLKDRFGLSWQIVPRSTLALLTSADRVRSGRAWQALMGMRKIDMAAVQRAYDGP